MDVSNFPVDGYRYPAKGTFDRFKLFREIEARYPSLQPTGDNQPAVLVADTPDGVVVWTRDPLNVKALATFILAHDPTPDPVPPTKKERIAALVDAIDETKPAAALKAIKAILKELD